MGVWTWGRFDLKKKKKKKKKKMAYKYTLEEAYKLKDSICWNGMFYELSGLSPLALSFSDVRFGASEASCNVGFEVLLKEWASMVDVPVFVVAPEIVV